MSRLKLALDQITFARGYTTALLDGLDAADWYRMPAEGITHVAWQVGHLAFAQFRLVLVRVRGLRPDDGTVLSEEFVRLFGAGSVPDRDATKYPSPAEIRTVFDRIHERVMTDMQSHPEADLDSPLLMPHRLAKTKFESLMWCAHHEMLHAGQIGLLRRLLGMAPKW
jgi:hypothetical protein